MNKSEFLAKGTEKKEKKKELNRWGVISYNKSLKPELDGSILSSKMLSLPQ